MESPAITVVIATFNRAELLERAIRSVQMQTYPHFIVSVNDNASTDSTSEKVAEMQSSDSRIRYHRHDTNIGAADNFLYGMRNVETPLFCFLSDDDVILPNLFENCVTLLAEYPEARFAAGGTVEMTEAGDFLFAPQAYWPRDGIFVPPDGLRLMLTGYHPSWNTIVFRRDVLREVGEFTKGLGSVTDIDYILRIACRYPFAISREPAGIFVRRENSYTELADVSVIGSHERMTQELLAAPGVGEEARRLIAVVLPQQLQQRLLKIALKQLLRAKPELSLETLRVSNARYGKSLPAMLIGAAAGVCNVFRPLLALARFAEALEYKILSFASQAATRRNGLKPIDIRKLRELLRQTC